MISDHLTGIEQFEAGLWKIADDLRANSGLASNEYFMPIMGLLFLRHASNRYYEALTAIKTDKVAGKMPDRPLVEADFRRRRALMLPKVARYDVLLEMPKDGNLGVALSAAMEAVENHFPPLAGQLPKDYERFDDELLERMLRMFDSEALRTASGDVFGRIYEYFLAEFSKQGAHDNGEFFTPPSIVQTIVNVIEPGNERYPVVAPAQHGFFGARQEGIPGHSFTVEGPAGRGSKRLLLPGNFEDQASL